MLRVELRRRGRKAAMRGRRAGAEEQICWLLALIISSSQSGVGSLTNPRLSSTAAVIRPGHPTQVPS